MGVFVSEGKRGVVYRYKFYLDGETYRGTLKVNTLDQAIQAEKAIRRAVEGISFQNQPDVSSPLLSDFIDEVFLPWSKRNKGSYYDDNLIAREIKEFFKDYRLSQITVKTCRRFRDARREVVTARGTPRANTTVNREMSVLSRILSLAVEEEQIQSNPARKVPRLRPGANLVRYLTREEERRLMAVLVNERAHLRPIVIIALHTGMRKKELLSLERWQIKFSTGEHGVIDLADTKTKRPRVIPMNSLVRRELEQICHGLAPSAPVFKSMKVEAALTDVKHGWRRALELAEIPNFRFHDLRHTFGTRLAEAGVPLHQIAELMGHADIRMTQRYVHATGAGKFAAVEQLVREQP